MITRDQLEAFNQELQNHLQEMMGAAIELEAFIDQAIEELLDAAGKNEEGDELGGVQ